ncbi:hypothetical protein [Streptomyces sp. SAI-229]|uniref:hypothetical protein n=1 Tax=Streptomyces sp. SAI-229 TaxID=3377731 RepID=UPI003C7D2804
MPGFESSVYEARYPWTPFQLLGGAWTGRLVAFRLDDRGVTLGGATGSLDGGIVALETRTG